MVITVAFGAQIPSTAALLVMVNVFVWGTQICKIQMVAESEYMYIIAGPKFPANFRNIQQLKSTTNQNTTWILMLPRQRYVLKECWPNDLCKNSIFKKMHLCTKSSAVAGAASLLWSTSLDCKTDKQMYFSRWNIWSLCTTNKSCKHQQVVLDQFSFVRTWMDAYTSIQTKKVLEVHKQGRMVAHSDTFYIILPWHCYQKSYSFLKYIGFLQSIACQISHSHISDTLREVW